jgi:hypothetical protein
MQRPDGFIDRKIILANDGSVIARGFDMIGHAQKLAFTGVLSPLETRFRRHAEYCEKHLMRHFFAGAMGREIMYIGSHEHLWQYAYLCMGQWKKAYAALQTNLKYGMSDDAFLTQERFSLTDPAYTPWQPNSSGNGRLLDMIVRQFYFEYNDPRHGDVIVFFGGMPPAWFQVHPCLALRGLYTPAGRISIETAGHGFSIACDGFSLHDKIIRIPEYFEVVFAGNTVTALEAGFFRVTQDVPTLTGTLTARLDS